MYLYNVGTYARNVMDAQRVHVRDLIDLMMTWLRT